MVDDVFTLAGIAIGAAAVVGLLLALRGVIWWYWGISRAVRALESIDASLRALPAVQAYRARLARERGRRAA